MTAFYVKSGSGAAEFQQSHTYSSGDRMVIVRTDTGTNYATARKWVWECTTGGQSASANPTWPASVTQDVTTVTSNAATFTARKPGYSSGTTANWTFAGIYADYVATALAAGDLLYISNNHAESTSNGNPYTIFSAGQGTLLAPIRMICVDDSAAPPTALATTATITNTNNASGITISSGFYYMYGITFRPGSGATGTCGFASGGGANGVHTYEKCQIQLLSSGAGSTVASGNNTCFELLDTDIKFGATGNSISVGDGCEWRGGSILAGTASPTTLITGTLIQTRIEGVDFSNLSSTFNFSNLPQGATHLPKIIVSNCKFPADWSGALIGTNTMFVRGEAYNCNNTGLNYSLKIHDGFGTIDHETSIVRDNGFSDGTTPISWKMTTTTSVFPRFGLRTPGLVIWNDTTGTSKTVTVEFIHDSTTALKADEIWLEVMALATTGSSQATWYTDKADVIGTSSDQPSSLATWQESMSNPNTQKLQVTFTPRVKGPFYAYVCLAKPSYTVYLDPMMSVA